MDEIINIEIVDFGPLKNTHIEVDKINIIGGENATGKSFTSKILFCFSLALSKQGVEIGNRNIKSYFEDYIKKINRSSSLANTTIKNHPSIINKLNSQMKNWETDNIQYKYLKKFYDEFKEILEKENVLDDNYLNNEFKQVENVIKFHKNEDNYIKQLIHYFLMEEFEENQILNFEKIDVNFNILGENQNINYELNLTDSEINIKSKSSNNNIFITTNNVIYLNTLTPIDLGNYNLPFDFRINSTYLSENKENKNVYDEIYNEKLHKFSKSISDIIGGKFIFDKNIDSLVFKTNGDTYNLSNMASGYKQIGMLQILLNKKYLTKDCILILDEPEVNLHPKLQIELAKLLIKMVKELNLTLYINSHSPLFIEAMEVFTIKYDLINNTNFYLSSKNNKTKTYQIDKIKRKEISKIYANLGDAYDTIEDVEVENILNKKF